MGPPIRPEDLYTTPVPVIRVYDGFEERDHEDIQGLFLKNGYKLITGGRHNPHNALELSIDLSSSFKVPDPVERAVIASRVTGIPLPESFPLGEVLNSDAPVVAKDKRKNRGENKFLLETQDQKIRFAAWMLYVQRLGVDRLTDQDYIEKLKREASSGHFYLNTGANPNWNRSWIFEEFVETPGDQYSSFRTLVDGYGAIHYGLVVRSGRKKTDEKRLITEPTKPLQDINLTSFDEKTLLLTDPRSPFFLNSKSIVSNNPSDIRKVLLDGVPKSEEEEREILRALGINPDLPENPRELTEAASKIGLALRAGIPFMGIDFMKRTDGSFVLLEVNTGPLLFPRALGEPDGTPQPKLYYRMYEEVIKGARAKFPTAFTHV